MKLEPRVIRLEHTNPAPVTAEMILGEVLAMDGYDDNRVAALSRRMPQAELEAAISELARMIEECDA